MGDSSRHERAELMLAEARMLLARDRVDDAAATLERAINLLDNRSSHRPDAIAELTPAEIRVARMAGKGMKNREIAVELAVSVKAIEYHLANTYRKLGIRGRVELTRMFSWAGPVLALMTVSG